MQTPWGWMLVLVASGLTRLSLCDSQSPWKSSYLIRLSRHVGCGCGEDHLGMRTGVKETRGT